MKIEGTTLYLQLLKKEGKKMKIDLFIKNLLIIIVILLDLNIILPILSNPLTSYAAKNIECKFITFSELAESGTSVESIEKSFNEYGKEGWEYIDNLFTDFVIFKR